MRGEVPMRPNKNKKRGRFEKPAPINTMFLLIISDFECAFRRRNGKRK